MELITATHLHQSTRLLHSLATAMPHCLEDWVMTPNLVERLRKHAHISHELSRAILSEFFCTAFLLFTGCCVNAQYILSKTTMNDWIGVTVGWGIALYLAASLGFRISGANMNPSISFFLLTQGRMSFIRFVFYAIAQMAGAFVGAALCFAVYYDAIKSFDGGIRQVTGNQSTAAIFATYPSDYITVFGACLDQTLGAAVLCIGIGTIIDRRNHIPTFMQPALVGLVVTLIASCLALNCGGAINPARDFGPRLFTLVAGYGWEVISYNDYQWFWIPIVCPMIGAAAGAWAYELFIGLHMPDDLEMTLADKQFHSEHIHSPHTVEYVPDFPAHRRFTADMKMPIV